MTREEEEEVRLLLSRHQERIMLDLGSTDLLAVLVKNSVLSQSEEDLLLKPYAAAATTTTTLATTVAAETGSAPSSVGALTKRKLSAVVSSSSGSGSGSGGSASVSVSGVGGDYSSSLAGSSRSASVNGDHAQSDNRSLTPSVGGSAGVGVAVTESLNDAEILRLQCANLIDIIARNGFEKFKQFCYAIECECPQLIEDLINDRLKSGK